ncbi:MAG: radical SAM protein [Verrucomicrobia bacterium]|nr:MAG: radical SAM protein [Verrucomicrobiota bacterium]
MAILLNTAKRQRPKTRFNWVASDFIRRLLVWKYQLQARVTGRGYYCAALHGESEYNLTINSDRTVSCNCQDYDTTGHLGDLRKNSFEEIYFGPIAKKFRDDLAAGKMPIPTCARCGDLKRLPAGAQPPPVKLPHRGMLLENTVRCNVDCTGCARENAATLRVDKQLQMPLPELEQMGDLMSRLGMKQIFYLNLGEPFLSPGITEELPMLRKKNPDCRIVTSTNGILINTDAKREAALNFSHIFFSVHGISDEMSEKYMHRGNFTKAYAAMKELAAYRNARGLTQPILEWKYLLFNWNDNPRHIERAIEMARAAGLDFISFWPTHNPFWGLSWRYHLGLLNHVGEKTWKGREVDLRPEGRRGTPTHPYFAQQPVTA